MRQQNVSANQITLLITASTAPVFHRSRAPKVFIQRHKDLSKIMNAEWFAQVIFFILKLISSMIDYSNKLRLVLKILSGKYYNLRQ